MGTEILGRDDIEDRSSVGLHGDGTVSAWDTNKRKEVGLTCGPYWSVAEEACVAWLATGARLGRGNWASACGAGPTMLGCASWADSRAKPSGPQRERNKAGRRGEEKATAATAGLRAEKKEEKKVILFFFDFFFKASSKCNFNSI